MKLKTGLKRIKEMVKFISDTDINEIVYDTEDLSIGILKSPKNVKKEKNKQKVKKKEKEVVEVLSESVGFFRDFSLPSRRVLVKVGQKIKKGEKISQEELLDLYTRFCSKRTTYDYNETPEYLVFEDAFGFFMRDQQLQNLNQS